MKADRQTSICKMLKVKTRSGNHMLPKIQAVASATDNVGLAPAGCWQLKTWGGEILKLYFRKASENHISIYTILKAPSVCRGRWGRDSCSCREFGKHGMFRKRGMVKKCSSNVGWLNANQKFEMLQMFCKHGVLGKRGMLDKRGMVKCSRNSPLQPPVPLSTCFSSFFSSIFILLQSFCPILCFPCMLDRGGGDIRATRVGLLLHSCCFLNAVSRSGQNMT